MVNQLFYVKLVKHPSHPCVNFYHGYYTKKNNSICVKLKHGALQLINTFKLDYDLIVYDPYIIKIYILGYFREI